MSHRTPPRQHPTLGAILVMLGVWLLAIGSSFATPAPAYRDREPPRLSDGGRIALPPTVIPQDPPRSDRRPVYVGAAFVMLAVALWWNRQRRDRFDREDRAEARAAARPARRRRTRDADADDLHAAARGDAERPGDSPAEPPGDSDPRSPP
jgi:hypothetical protein